MSYIYSAERILATDMTKLMGADLDMRSKVRRHWRSSLIDAVLILDGVLQGGDVDPILHQHVGRMLKLEESE